MDLRAVTHEHQGVQFSLSAADNTARDALTLTAADVGRICRVGSSAPYTFYQLTNATGPAWASLGSSGSPIEQGRHTIWVPAAAMAPRTTNGAAAGSLETATNDVMVKTLDFDAAVSEGVQFSIRMPKSWNESTVTAQFVWSHAATTTNFGVAFGLQGVALSNANAIDTAFGTGQLGVDTGGTTDTVYSSPETAAITIANTPAELDLVVFQVYRAVSDGGDTMAIDARLHGLSLYYTINAATDA
jgi:hypothetical protein